MTIFPLRKHSLNTHHHHLLQHTLKMVNTRAKIRKTHNTRVSEDSDSDSDHQSTRSGVLIGSNDDLLTEILHRLPVTSILGFKSVSKHWQWLLCQRHFIQMHDNLLKSPTILSHYLGFYDGHMYVPYDVENRSTPRPFRSLESYFDPLGISSIVQSCNGLLLCCSNRNNGTRKYHVFNPTTKQHAIIKSLPGGYKVNKTICFMCLAYHQTDCVRYKFVCLRSLESGEKLFQIQIYSSDTRKWKISIESFYMDWDFFCERVYWNGAIHWTPSYRNHLYFNIDAQRLQTSPLPVQRTFYETTRTMYFGESRGHLHLIVAPDHDDTTLDVYEMLSDCSGWFVNYQIEFHELWGTFPEMSRSPFDFNVLDVVRGDKEEDTFIVLIIPGK